MANEKFTELPVADTPLAGTEIACVVQGGVSKQTPISNFGGSSYLVATKQLNNDEIKNLPTTRIKIIDAPELNKYIQVLGYNISSTWVADYTGVNPSAFIAFWNAITSGTQISAAWTSMPNYVGIGDFADFIVELNSYSVANVGEFSGLKTDFSNMGVYLSAYNGGAINFGGGNENNVLNVSIYYLVVDL